jgi:hypothetical protein
VYVIISSRSSFGGCTRTCNVGSLVLQQVTLLQNSAQIEHKIHISTVDCMDVRGLTASCYVVYDYNTGIHNWAIVCICNVYIYIQYTYIIQYMYLFMINPKSKGLT